MYWRLKSSEFNSLKPPERKDAMNSLIRRGKIPGIICVKDEEVVGWCSFGNRSEYPKLENSRVLKRVDEQDVWSIVCFYVKKSHRREGITKELLKEALKIAKENGAQILEGYPIDPKVGSYPDPYAYTGLISTFKELGFKEVARRSEKRPVMRYYLKDQI